MSRNFPNTEVVEFTDEEVDAILLCSMDLFENDFYLPVYWQRKSFKNNQIAEWGNMMVCEEMGMFHMISIDFSKMMGVQDLEETFIHELVHAWQFEKGLPVDHADSFLEKAVWFADLGFNILSEDCNLENAIKLQAKKLEQSFSE